jgi:hypothetical protein
MKKRKMDPAEKLFARILLKYPPESVTYAIEKNVDLAQGIKENLAPELPMFKRMARIYMRMNPKYRKIDPDEATKRIIEGIGEISPEHAKRILEGPPEVNCDKPEELGLVPSGSGDAELNPGIPNLKYPDAGFNYVKEQYAKIRRLLGV